MVHTKQESCNRWSESCALWSSFPAADVTEIFLGKLLEIDICLLCREAAILRQEEAEGELGS